MALEKKNEGIIMYREYLSYFELLSIEDRGELITAVFRYAFGEEDGEALSPAARMAFMFITDQINRDTEKYEKKCEKNRRNGLLGGRPPKKAKEEREEATDRGEDVEESSYNNDGDGDMDDISEGFEEFISKYPKKKDRDEAWREYKKLSPDEELRARIMEKLREEIKREDWQKEGGRYVPRASVWLQRREWEKDGKDERYYCSAFGVPPSGGSFDTDDFFGASMKRAEEYLSSYL